MTTTVAEEHNQPQQAVVLIDVTDMANQVLTRYADVVIHLYVMRDLLYAFDRQLDDAERRRSS